MYEYKVFGPHETPKDLFHFRYKIYIEELGRPQKHACHETKTIRDELDDTARQVVGYHDGKIIACIRANLLKHGSVGYYEKFYGLEQLSDSERNEASICTRLSVAPEYRRHPAATVHTFQKLYDFGVRNKIKTSYLDCYEDLIGFFERFGYEYLQNDDHEIYGRVAIMRLYLQDFDRLIENKTMFAKQAAGFKDSIEASCTSEKHRSGVLETSPV